MSTSSEASRKRETGFSNASATAVAPSVERLPTNHFAFADGLRALAILFVVLNHFALFGHLTLLGHKNDLAFLGRWGVNCFFLLSGFLLSRSFLKAILESDRRFPSVGSFLLRRFYRIYPLYALAVIVSGLIGIYVKQGGPVLPFVATHLSFAQGFLVDQINNEMNAPLWTMVIDVEFYLALPLVAIVARLVLRGRSRREKRTVLFSSLAALSLFSLAYRYFAFKHAPLAADDFDLALVFVRNFVGMLPAFALGAALALTQLEFDLTANRRLALLVMVFGIGIFMVLGVLKSSGSSLTVKVIADFFAALSAAAIFYGIWIVDIRALTRLFSSSIVSEAAALAYGIYLFHWPILSIVAKTLDKQHGSASYLVISSVLSAALIVPVAYVVHRFVERPFLSANERLRRTSQ